MLYVVIKSFRKMDRIVQLYRGNHFTHCGAKTRYMFMWWVVDAHVFVLCTCLYCAHVDILHIYTHHSNFQPVSNDLCFAFNEL